VGLAELLVQDQDARDRLETAEKSALAAESDLPEPSADAPAQPPITLAQEPAYDYAKLADVGGAPGGLAVGKDGTVYFTRDKAVRKLGPDNVPVDVATLVTPDALAVEPISGKVYVVDDSDRKIHEVGGGAFGPDDVTVFTGLAADGQGGLLAADVERSKVWRINPADGSAKELAGAARPDGRTPGVDGNELNKPWGVAPGPNGVAYVSESGSRRIWQLDPDGTPMLLAGLGQQADPIVDGFYIGAGFKQPYRLATAPDGSILVVDHPAGRLRRVRLQAGAGAVTTIDVPLDGLKDVAVGPDGTIYVILDFDPAIHTLKPRS
jgi:streptogramin lyase